MEKQQQQQQQSKFVVVQDGNPRGKNISKEEIAQCITDLSFFYSKHAQLKSNLKSPATNEQLTQLSSALTKAFHFAQPKIIPIALEEMLKKFNGGIQLHEGFLSLSTDSLVKCLEEMKGKSGWEQCFIPIAKDLEGNILVATLDGEEEKEVKIWSEDGSVEVAGENMGLYLENLRNQILQKKIEFIEDIGLVAKV